MILPLDPEIKKIIKSFTEHDLAYHLQHKTNLLSTSLTPLQHFDNKENQSSAPTTHSRVTDEK